MPQPIVVVGSLNIDLVTRTAAMPREGQTVPGSDFQIHPGGKGANQAVAAARLGAPVSMVGRLGDDVFAAMLRAALEGDGVQVDAVLTSPGPSGVAVIVVADTGENSIIVTPGANALLVPEDLDAHQELIGSAACVLTQLEIPLATVEHLTRMCSRAGVPLILDPAPAAQLSAEILAATTWFTPNETEAGFYLTQMGGRGEALDSGQLAQQLLATGPAGVVLKQGGRGAYLAAHGGGRGAGAGGDRLAEQIAAFPVSAMDSTGAGDTFNGAFAAALYGGAAPREAARFASAAAAISVTRAGAQPSMPTRDEVEAFLKQPAAARVSATGR